MGRKRKRQQKRSYDNSYRDDFSRELIPSSRTQYAHRQHYQDFLRTYNEQLMQNQRLFPRAESQLSSMLPGRPIVKRFNEIKLEITHLIPLFSHLAPELILIDTLDEDSILLGRIDRYYEYCGKAYIRDIEEGEICLKLHSSSDIAKPGRFVAVQNPKLTIFENGEFGFRPENEGCVHFVDVDSSNEFFLHVLVIAIGVVCMLLKFVFN